MPARSPRSRARAAWVAVLAVLVWVTGAGAAAAAPTPATAPVSITTTSQTAGIGEQLVCGILGTINPINGMVCGVGQDIVGGVLQNQDGGDGEKSAAGGSSLVCTVAPIVSPVLGLVCPVLVDGVEQVAKVAGLVLNPERAYQHFANDLKEDAITWFTRSISYVVDETTFDAGAQWWREAYAATAGIGMAVMVVMILTTLRRAAVGKIGPAKASEVITQYVPVAVLMMMFGPPVGYVLGRITGGMNAGILKWMGPDVVDMLTNGAVFTQMTAASGFGMGIGILMFLVLLLASLGVFGTWLTQSLSTHVIGAVGGVAWGMSVDPQWRPKALRVVWLFVGLLFAKPAGLLVIGIIAKYLGNMDPKGGLDDPTQLLVQGLTFIIALVMIAFSPWAVMKFFPLLPDGSESVNSSGPTMATSVAGGMGSIATTMLMLHARGSGGGGGGGGGGSGGGSSGDAPRSAKSGGGATKPKSGGQEQNPGRGKQPDKSGSGAGSKNAARSDAPGGGRGSRASKNGGTGAGAERDGAPRDPATSTSPAAKGAGGLGSKNAGAASAGGGSASGAGAAGGKAASAAGGAATGGALLAAQLAAAGVTAVASKAKEASAAAAPQTGGGEQ